MQIYLKSQSATLTIVNDINEAYDLLDHYVENFIFQLSNEEFQDQHPSLNKISGD